MRLFADENLESAIVDWLRSTGHDVVYACEIDAGRPDTEWLHLAVGEQRIIITSDLDFGALVFQHQQETAGVVQLRLHRTPPPLRLATLILHWPTIEAAGTGQFVTVTERAIRIRPIE